MNNLQYSHLLHLQEASKQGRLVVFVGAGVSANSGVPTWKTLIDSMRKECNLENEGDDLKVAQLYRDARGKKEFMDKVKDVLRYNKVIPNVIHKDILELKPCHIITTNYDNLIEQEIQNEYKQFAIVREDKDMPNMSYPNSLIKMHGDFDTNNIVLTESDYHNYASNFPLIRAFVLSLFASKLVVFLGFSFSDLNLKIILNELHSVLKDNMQRGYLISDTRPNILMSKYYENKGINVVFLENTDIAEILGSNPTIRQTTLNNSKGIYLDHVLQCIHLVKKDLRSDLLSTLYTKIKTYNDEIKVFGDGIFHIISHEVGGENKFSYNGLQLDSQYFKAIHSNLKSFENKKKFVKVHPHSERQGMKRLAYSNCLYKLDSLTIFNFDDILILNKHFSSSSTISYFYKMDFNKLNASLKDLSSRDYSNNANDLEYPFILCKLRQYYEAYQIYERLLSSSWKNGKYIMYFICLYNIRSIRFMVHKQLDPIPNMNAQDILDKCNKINLSEVLSRLPIDEEIRMIFQDLLSSRELGKQAIDTETLERRIHQQRKSGESNGVAFGDYINPILYRFVKTFCFSNNNFIICDNDIAYMAISTNTLTSILNSYAIPNTTFYGIEGRPMIKELSPLCTFILIFCINNEKLIDIFLQYEIGNLKLSKGAEDYINLCLNNLTCHKPFWENEKQVVSEYVNNLLFIVSKTSEKNVEIEPLYNVIITFWNLLNYDILYKLIALFEPPKDIANTLLDLMFKNPNNSIKIYPSICELTKYYKKSKKTYNHFNFRDSKYKKWLRFYYPVYDALDANQKIEFSEYCQNNLTFPYSYLKFIDISKRRVLSNIKFKEILENLKKTQSNIYIKCCFILSKLRLNGLYSNVFSLIDDFAKEDECMKFYLSPETYKNKKDVDTQWLLTLEKEKLISLMEFIEYKEKLKKYAQEKYLDEGTRNKIIRIL